MTEEEFNVALDAVRNGKEPQDKNWSAVYGAMRRVNNAFGESATPFGWQISFIDRLDKKGRAKLKKIAEGECGRLELYWWLVTDELSKASPSQMLNYAFFLGLFLLFAYVIISALWSNI